MKLAHAFVLASFTAATPTQGETFALDPSQGFETVATATDHALTALLKSATLRFDRLARSHYHGTPRPEPKATRDRYFGSDARLRESWDSAGDAIRHKWLPFLAAFAPRPEGQDVPGTPPVVTTESRVYETALTARHPLKWDLPNDAALRIAIRVTTVVERAPGAPHGYDRLLELEVGADPEVQDRYQTVSRIVEQTTAQNRGPDPALAAEAVAFASTALVALEEDAADVRSTLVEAIAKALDRPPLVDGSVYEHLTARRAGDVAERPSADGKLH